MSRSRRPTPDVESSVARWEQFFNAPGLKQALASRYIYEHLFFGTLYCEGPGSQARV